VIVFLGDIAFILELGVIGAGLVTLYYAMKEKSKLLKLAGYIMAVGGLLTALCTGYFSTKYWLDGAYDSATPMKHHRSM
tara:strand:- start:28416 stop:28652 length:237 start_codon:yes stop_codon:yes gene_type:complete